MSQSITITLSPQVISELEPVMAETHESIEEIVNLAVAEYLRVREKRQLREVLAQDYQKLAAMWNEMTDDLAGENWLVVENEALEQTEASLTD